MLGWADIKLSHKLKEGLKKKWSHDDVCMLIMNTPLRGMGTNSQMSNQVNKQRLFTGCHAIMYQIGNSTILQNAPMQRKSNWVV